MWACLLEKGVAFQLHHVLLDHPIEHRPLLDVEKPAWLLDLNPRGRVRT